MPKHLFGNPWPHDYHRILDILKWKLGVLPRETPIISNAPDQPADWIALSSESIALAPDQGWRISWLGHASFLIQGAGIHLLVDPVFSSHCAPLPLSNLLRKIPPPCHLDDLPTIDAVLLTHSHYDHMDLPTLRKLGHDTRLFVAEGHAAWLNRKGFKNTTEVKWRQSITIKRDVILTATPAQHFTARTPWDRDHAHWCGWLIEGEASKIWHAGDSGYCAGFKEIGKEHGPIDFAMIPIGAYQPRRIMKAMHMNPEEAVQALIDTQCRSAVAMHWGTFKLTDEPMGEPPLRFLTALESHGLDPEKFLVGAVGQIWNIHP